MKSPCLLLRASLSISLLFCCKRLQCRALILRRHRTPPAAPRPRKFRNRHRPRLALPSQDLCAHFCAWPASARRFPTEEVLPLLARNVAVEGYQGRKDRTGRPTEFLILLKRYVEQARATGHTGRPGGNYSGCELRSGGAIARHSRLPAARRVRKERGTGDGRSGARLSNH